MAGRTPRFPSLSAAVLLGLLAPGDPQALSKPVESDRLDVEIPLDVRSPLPDNAAPTLAPDEAPRGKRIAFLGISMEEVPWKLRREMELEPGEGVFVREVLPDTAAAAAGLQALDIVLRLNDTPLRGRMHMSRVIQELRLGDKVEVEVLRGGQRLKLKAVLGERLMPEAEALARRQIMFNEPFPLDIVPPQVGDDLDGMNQLHRRLLERQRLLLQRLERDLPDDDLPDEARAELQAIRDMLRQRLRDLDPPGAPDQPDANDPLPQPRDGFHLRRMMDDGRHRITLVINGRDRHLKALDAFGKVLFDGPINTAEEKAKIPKEIAAKIKALEP